ncbi:acyl-CoA dehydrogenase family protein [Paenibacillus oleatilyticus]|uniref:acyl-CoA dehydrogenase family protein n=1 Tax=Paenibacillus oleatilyticus TaxID=2594886 RepID=UPI001C1F9E2D|nr:acyl-CoA dehydrogenase family protein [Paenibacillus oleatilyticus]MBU7318170.1 acyl-CoA dehydrogenase family protein [Paenibacillus oleatilyticus]
MELCFTDEQERFRSKVREYAVSRIAPSVPDMEESDAFPRALVSEMGGFGLLGLLVPKEWGGSGADMISYMIAIEEISKASATVGVILSVHTSVATLPILYYGTEEQKAKYLPRLASGEWLGAFALTESHAGSDAARIRTSAVWDGTDYILNGSKVFITNAGEADVYIVFAATGPGQGASGVSAFIVEKAAPGFRVEKKEKKMGLRGSNTCELTFDQVRLPAAQRLGQEGQGFVMAKSILDGGRIGIGAQALGIARAALEHTELLVKTRYAKERQRAMEPVLTELAARVEASSLLVYRAAWLRQNGKPCTKEASMAKMFASDTAMSVTTEALQLFGGSGWTNEHPLERLFRDAKVTQIYEGTNQIHRIVISNELLKP